MPRLSSVFLLFLAACAFAQSPQLASIQILGVRPDMPAPLAEPAPSIFGSLPTSGQAVPAASALPACAGAELAALKAKLHPGGQKTALILRGGRFGINAQALAILKRIADVFQVDPSVQTFIRTYLSEAYISDDGPVQARLEQMGYRVVKKTSLDYAGNLAKMKDEVLEVLRRPETTVVVFYGHGATWGAWLTDDRENNVPGLAELLRKPDDKHPTQVLTVDDVLAARGANKLDAMIMHGCQQGTNPYLKEIRKTGSDHTFADCVKPDGMGFFAGWVTYSVYLTPQSLPILDRFFCHAAQAASLAGEARARSSRYWLRAVAIGRKMSLLAFGSDGSSLDEAVLAADPQMNGHTMDYLSNVVPVRLLIDALYELKLGKGTLGADVRTFLVDYYRYAKANKIPMRQAGQGAPPHLSGTPTTAEINRLMEYHGGIIIKEALTALAPGLVNLKSRRIYFHDREPGKLFADLSFEVRKAAELEEVIKLLRRMHEQQLADGLAANVGGGIGPQLAGRLGPTVDELVKALDTEMIAATIELSIEKAQKADGNNTLKATVYGYNVCVGEVSHARRMTRDAPYELHVSLSTVERLAKKVARSLFGDEIQVYASRIVDLYAKLHGDISVTRVDNETLWLRMKVQVRGDWALVADGYGYVWVNAHLTVRPGGGLAVAVTPEVSVRFLEGWPFPDWVGRIVARKVSDKITARLQERIGTIDFAPYIPAEVRGEIANVVRIDTVKFDWEALKVQIRRE